MDTSFLSQFDEEFDPRLPVVPGPKDMDDGDYVFTALGAEFVNVSGHNLLRVSLRVDEGESFVSGKVEWPVFLSSQTAVNRLGYDLQSLGFPANQWKGRISTELPKAVAALKGITFRARKSSRVGNDGKDYHEIMVLGRVGNTVPMPSGPVSEDTVPF